MVDKVQKIREEVARIQLYTQSETLKQVLSFIDSLEEEPKPKFKVGDIIKFKGVRNEDVTRVITNIQKGDRGGFWYFFADGSIYSIGDDGIELVSIPDKKEPTIPDIVDEHYWEMFGEEPVSEDLEEVCKEVLKRFKDFKERKEK